MTKTKKSSYETEKEKCRLKILEYKLGAEANIVSILYKKSDYIYASDLKLEDFSHNVWKVYWSIIKSIIKQEEKIKIDDITVGLYLEKHDKLRDKYESYGGFNTIEKAMSCVSEENYEGYVLDLHKWNTILTLLDNGFPVIDELSTFSDYNIEDIYNKYESMLNHIFVNVDTKVKSYDMADGLYELIDELNEGLAVGLPYNKLELLNKETGGMLNGNVTLIGGVSNAGKSSFVRNVILPSIIKKKTKIVCILNEENEKRWKRELLVWVANVVLKKDVQKYTIRDGKYTAELLQILRESADWIKENSDNNNITLIPLQVYSTNLVKKIINKYSAMGVNFFVLDTFKFDSTNAKISDQIQKMALDMVSLYDTVKDSNKNVHLTCTFQLTKSSAKQRYFTMENTGVSKNIFDSASTGIMIRNFFPDEYTGGKNELKVFRMEGKKGLTKIPVTTNESQHLQILFLVKNRDGKANEYQIIIESDLSRNIVKEIGFASVPIDF